jgi:hypothetical protein
MISRASHCSFARLCLIHLELAITSYYMAACINMFSYGNCISLYPGTKECTLVQKKNNFVYIFWSSRVMKHVYRLGTGLTGHP